MSLKIVKPSDSYVVSNLITVIMGQPGIGKTSLAFSASNPISLDFDGGSHRSIGIQDHVSVTSWNDVSNLTASDFDKYDTIIIDTVGKCLRSITEWLIKSNSKLEFKGALTQQGYGVMARTFQVWLDKLRSFKKDIVILSHIDETISGDTVKIRVDIMGQKSKGEIYQNADLMGYIYMESGKRVLNFNPSDTFFGKNCAGLPILVVPEYSENSHFLKDIIQKAKDKMSTVGTNLAKDRESLEHAQNLINEANDLETINGLLVVDFILSSPELKRVLHKKATSLNLNFNKETKQYESNS